MQQRNRKKIRIGSRKSLLALTQTNYILSLLKVKFPEISLEVDKIKTTGDTIQDKALHKINNKGLFTKEIEDSLIRRDIDMAVHSLKDLPTILPDSLIVSGVPKREDPHDVLISKDNVVLEGLPKNAVIGTSSLRRRAGLLHYRKDFRIEELRGNLNTRIEKIKKLNLDAIVVAEAGIKRIGYYNMISERISYDIFLPSAGQGALAIETRTDDLFIIEMLKGINDSETQFCVEKERALMNLVGSNCQIPMGVLATIDKGRVKLQAQVFSSDARVSIRDEITKDIDGSRGIEEELINSLYKKGAKAIIDEFFDETKKYNR